MTQFTRKSFSVASPHTEEYGYNFDRIFRKPMPESYVNMFQEAVQDMVIQARPGDLEALGRAAVESGALPDGVDESGQIVRQTTSMERWSRVVQLLTRVVSEELTPEQAADYFVQGGGERVWFESMWMLIKEI